MKLNFAPANQKLKSLQKLTGKKLFSFSVLSGHTCPGAKDCQSFAIETPQGLRIRDGKKTDFRCFSASQEVLFKNVYLSRKQNTEIIAVAAKSPGIAAGFISNNIPKKAEIIRIHVGGDFKTLNYFNAWILTAKMNPNILFYAYTKSIPFWVKLNHTIPDNFILTASMGGKYDDVAIMYNFKSATVYDSLADVPVNMEIDHDDSLALLGKSHFALLVHGTQKNKKAKSGYGKKGFWVK